MILALLAKKPEARPASGAAVAQVLREEVERISVQELAEAQDAAEARAQAEAVPAAPDLAALARLEQEDSHGGAAAAELMGKTAPARDRTRPAPPPAPAPPPVNATDLVTSPLVRKMLRTVLAEPVILSADERYLMGHYLAYLLIGSRRRGLLLRRPLDRRNADRARFLLAMTYALAAGPTEEAVQEAASLLDQQIEVRPALSPVVVAKYLSWRDTPQRRRLFRQTRKALPEASKHAQKHMTDAKGQLNPGLVPQTLDHLRKIAPARNVVDDVLVERWNRLAEVWRDHPDFRAAALRYASPEAHRDPASQALWPEVVYPLIELARWQRRYRSRAETLWDSLVAGSSIWATRGRRSTACSPALSPPRSSLRSTTRSISWPRSPLSTAGRRRARSHRRGRPADRVAGGQRAEPGGVGPRRTRQGSRPDHPGRSRPRAVPAGQLHELWKEAVNALASQARPGASGSSKAPGHKHIPLGPYRLVVVASIRGRAAGQVAIQGMANKQIELTTPSFRTTGSAGKPILAVWIYRDNSLVISQLDFQGSERYMLWHAPLAHQVKFDDPTDLHRELENLSMEPPEQVDAALSRRFRPRNTV